MTKKPRSILLMRHAKSSWNHEGLSDHDRPLNKRGRKAAPYMGRLMKERGLVPDVIYSSTARRAQETTEAFVKASGFAGQVITTPRLYHAEPKAYIDVFSEVRPGTSCAMFVAHNPGIADLIEALTGWPQEMCTAGIVHVSVPAEEIAGIETTTRGVFEGFYRPPRDLDE